MSTTRSPNEEINIPMDNLLSVSEKRKKEIYTGLLEQLQKDELKLFEKLLFSNEGTQLIRENYADSEHNNLTILEHICCEAKYAESNLYIKSILKIDRIDVNYYNSSNKGKRPMHLAVEYGNVPVIAALLSHKGIKVNNQDDDGNTAMHIAAEKGDYKTIVQLSSGSRNWDFHVKNKNDETALLKAIRKKHKSCVSKLLELMHFKIDQICLNLLEEKFPGFMNVLEAFKCIHRKDFDGLKQVCEKKEINLDSDNGQYTLLQYACYNGFHDAVKLFIENGAKLNLRCKNSEWYDPPFFLAARYGFYKIIQLFIDGDNDIVKSNLRCNNSGEKKEGLQYSIMYKGGYYTIPMATINGVELSTITRWVDNHPNISESGHEKCMKILLENNNCGDDGHKFDVNEADCNGYTPFRYVIENIHDEKIANLLFQHGAFIWGKGKSAVSLEESYKTVKSFDVNMMEEFLDDRIYRPHMLEKELNESKQKIIFKYDFLFPPENVIKKNDQFLETRLLTEIGNNENARSLLLHPVLSSFIDLKWHLFRKLFFINFILTVMFSIILTSFILICKHDRLTINTQYTVIHHIIQYSMYLLFSLFFLRESTQLLMNYSKYVRNPENYLEMAIIILTSFIIFEPFISNSIVSPIVLNYLKSFINQIEAITLLLCWTELVLMVGRHPSFATNMEMLKLMCKNSFEFTICYAILVCGFAISFYTLFDKVDGGIPSGGNETAADVAQSNDNFQDIFLSFFKVFIMSTGEFNSDSFPFHESPIISRIILMIFVFLITITFINLLIGFAVGDVQEIQENAYLIKLIQRANYIFFIELMIAKFKSIHLYDKLLKLLLSCEEQQLVNKINSHYTLSTFRTEVKGHWRLNNEIWNKSVEILSRKKLRLNEVTLQKLQEGNRQESESRREEMRAFKQELIKEFDIIISKHLANRI